MRGKLSPQSEEDANSAMSPIAKKRGRMKRIFHLGLDVLLMALVSESRSLICILDFEKLFNAVRRIKTNKKDAGDASEHGVIKEINTQRPGLFFSYLVTVHILVLVWRMFRDFCKPSEKCHVPIFLNC